MSKKSMSEADICTAAAHIELLRTRLFTPVTGTGSEIKPLAVVSYNLVHGTHFKNIVSDVGHQGSIYSSLLQQLTPEGRLLVFTQFNAVAYMNRRKGALMPTDGQPATMVRTFFEKFQAASANGVTLGFRVRHMVCRAAGTNGNGAVAAPVANASALALQAQAVHIVPPTGVNAMAGFLDMADTPTQTHSVRPAPNHAEGTVARREDISSRSEKEDAEKDDDEDDSDDDDDEEEEEEEEEDDDDDDDDSDQASELSSDVDEEDEAAVQRSDAKRERAKREKQEAKAKKSKSTPAKGAEAAVVVDGIPVQAAVVEDLTTFSGGYQASALEGKNYKRAVQANKYTKECEAILLDFQKATDRSPAEASARSKAVLQMEHIEFESCLGEMLSQGATIVDQFRNIALPYLRQDGNAFRRPEELAEHDAGGPASEGEHAFLDTRIFVQPDPKLDLDLERISNDALALNNVVTFKQLPLRIDPENVFNEATAMAYHTSGVEESQCNLLSYYALNPEDEERVLARIQEIGGETAFDDGGDSRATGDGDVVTDPEAAHALRVGRASARARILAHAFTKHSRRIELIELAAPTPAKFRGFPFPETVYELRPEFCRAELVPLLPIPHDVGVPVPIAIPVGFPGGAPTTVDMVRALENVDRTRAGLGSPFFAEHIHNLVAATLAIRVNTEGAPCVSYGPPERAATRQHADTIAGKLSSVYLRVLAGETRTIENTKSARRIACAIIDARRELGVHALTHYAYILTCTLNYRFYDLCKLAEGTHCFETLLHRAFVRDAACALGKNEEKIMEEYALEARERGASEADIERTLVGARAIINLVAREENRIQANKTAVAGRADLVRTTQGDGTGARRAILGQLPAIATTALSSVPQEIIDRDIALQLNRENTRHFTRLHQEFMLTNNTNMDEYKNRFLSIARAATKTADEAFWGSDNTDTRIQDMRKWFLGLSEGQREPSFSCPLNMTPFAACMLWTFETLVSPVINLATNANAMITCYFSSLHASRWYEDSNDPHLNVLMAGDGMSGKSFILNAVNHLSTPGMCNVTDHVSTHAMHVKKNLDGFCYIMHELQHRYLFPAVSGKDGGSGESGDALTFLKSRLTKGRSSIVVLKMNKETGERDIEMFESSNQGVTLAATNDSLTNADENMLSRFLVLSVPRPREQAEGSYAADRENADSVENIKITDEHYKADTVRAHQLVRFRVTYTEFMIKAGVIHNGFLTYSSRVLIDAVLTEMAHTHSTDTHDPRKRKLTEEMARSMAIFYSQWVALGTPYARKYASQPGAPPIWDWRAWFDLSIPFMYTGKEATIAALTLLESVWAPSYYNHVLYSMAFDIAQIHTLDTSSFLRLYRPMASGAPRPDGGDGDDDGGGTDAPLAPHGVIDDARPYTSSGRLAAKNKSSAARGGRAGGSDYEVNYDYLVIEDQNDSAIYRRVADACGRYGIRAADIETFVARQCRQFITTHHLVRKPYEAPAPPPQPEAHAPPVLSDALSRGNQFHAAAVEHEQAHMPINAGMIRALQQHPTVATPPSVPAEAPIDDAMDIDGPFVSDAATSLLQPFAMPAAAEGGDTTLGEDTVLLPNGVRMTRAEVAIVEAIESRQTAGTKPAAPLGTTVHGVDGIQIVEDHSRPSARLPVMVRGFKDTGKSTGWRQLRISVAFLMKYLGFDIKEPKTMRDLMATENVNSHDPMSNTKIAQPRPLSKLVADVPQAYYAPPKSFEWGTDATRNFCERMNAARRMALVNSDDASPMARSIATVLENAYLGMPENDDADALKAMQLLVEHEEKRFFACPDPSRDKRLLYPWNNIITCFTVPEYVIKSVDYARYPNGRRIGFQDCLRVMPLQRKAGNTRPLQRINYAKLDRVGDEVLNGLPLGDTGDDYKNTEARTLGSTRTHKLRGAGGIKYTSDMDYIETMERMASMCHPGLPFTEGSIYARLGSWPPLTYDLFMNKLALPLMRNGHLNPLGRKMLEDAYSAGDRPVLYPEDDPRLIPEYPTMRIVQRIRSVENVDRNEKAQVYTHLISIAEALDLKTYTSSTHSGSITFHAQTDAPTRKRTFELDDASIIDTPFESASKRARTDLRQTPSQRQKRPPVLQQAALPLADNMERDNDADNGPVRLVGYNIDALRRALMFQ